RRAHGGVVAGFVLNRRERAAVLGAAPDAHLLGRTLGGVGVGDVRRGRDPAGDEGENGDERPYAERREMMHGTATLATVENLSQLLAGDIRAPLRLRRGAGRGRRPPPARRRCAPAARWPAAPRARPAGCVSAGR